MQYFMFATWTLFLISSCYRITLFHFVLVSILEVALIFLFLLSIPQIEVLLNTVTQSSCKDGQHQYANLKDKIPYTT